MGIPLSRIYELTKIDMWFLKQYEELHILKNEISNYKIDSFLEIYLLRGKTKRIW